MTSSSEKTHFQPLQPSRHNRFSVELESGWTADGNFTAGYLQWLVAKAALKRSKHSHPVVVATNFLTVARSGPAELDVHLLRREEQRDVFRVSMRQGENVTLVATLVTATLQQSSADIDRCRPLELPPPDRCTVVESDGLPYARHHGIFDHVELRLAPECTGMLYGSADGSFLLRGWLRMASKTPIDPVSCLVSVDAFPPVTVTIGRYDWPPVLQMTTYVRALPVMQAVGRGMSYASGWFRGEKRGRLLAGGWLDEDCTMRDATGQIVVQARRFLALN